MLDAKPHSLLHAAFRTRGVRLVCGEGCILKD
jgi:hypothetical protein